MIRHTILLVSLFVLSHGRIDRIVCHTSNCAVNQKGFGKFTPETYALEAKPCTHLVFGELLVKNSAIVPRLDTDYKTIEEIKNAINEQNSTLKFLLSVGDYQAGTAEWTKMAATAFNRINFCQSALDVLRKWDFDGLHLNWQWPAIRGGPATDKYNYYRLIELLQQMFTEEAANYKRPKLILTAGFNCDSYKVGYAYDVKRIHPHLDFLSLVAMNFQGAWNSYTGHPSPLFKHLRADKSDPFSNRNADWCVQYYLGEGVPPDKMNLGLAAFGRTFKVNQQDHEIVPSLGYGTPKHFTQRKGQVAFFEACRLFLNPHAKFVPMTVLKKAYVRAIVVGDQYIGMEDPKSINDKVCYANKYKLGGITFYNLEFDDFSGWFCNQGQFPLLQSAFEATVVEPRYICPKELLADDQKSVKDSVDVSTTIQVNTCFTTIIALCAILYNAQLFGVN